MDDYQSFYNYLVFFFQAEDGIRDGHVTGVQTCALPIVLNESLNMILCPKDFPELSQYKGQTIITTDGTTLLGADDKAGVAEIVTAMEYLVANPHIKHGRIAVAFTPDEEVGRGADFFDVEKFGAEWAYTMDGSEIGELEYEKIGRASRRERVKRGGS